MPYSPGGGGRKKKGAARKGALAGYRVGTKRPGMPLAGRGTGRARPLGRSGR